MFSMGIVSSFFLNQAVTRRRRESLGAPQSFLWVNTKFPSGKGSSRDSLLYFIDKESCSIERGVWNLCLTCRVIIFIQRHLE